MYTIDEYIKGDIYLYFGVLILTKRGKIIKSASFHLIGLNITLAVSNELFSLSHNIIIAPIIYLPYTYIFYANIILNDKIILDKNIYFTFNFEY